MPVFTDTEHFYSVLVPFFNRLKDDPDIGPKVLASGLVIRFDYTEPDATISIDCPNNAVVQGDPDVNADVTLSMKAEIAHKFWLGNINLMVALTRRQMIAKGPIAKIMKLLPIIKNSYDMYKAYLQEIGMGDAIEVK